MVTDHRAGNALGFGEVCFCTRCLRLPWRRLTWWGLLSDLTPGLLERRLRREGLSGGLPFGLSAGGVGGAVFFLAGAGSRAVAGDGGAGVGSVG
jgi:hypothetical protein